MFFLIGLSSDLLPIICYLLFFKRNKIGGLWVIFSCCVASILMDYELPLLTKVTHLGIFHLFSIFTIIEYGLFTTYIYLSLKEKRLRYSTLAGSAIFCFVAIQNLTTKHKSDFDSLPASIEAILIVIYCIFFFYEQVKTPEVLYIYHSKKFWIVVGMMLYFAPTLFLFLYTSFLTRQETSSYWFINDTFNILKNILFAISFIINESNRKTSPLQNLYTDI